MTEADAVPTARPAGLGGKSALLLMAALVIGLVLGIVVAGLGDGIKEPLVQAAGLHKATMKQLAANGGRVPASFID